jgi:succinate dehydrogenase / fumarate reductase membrane anchor subunit
MATPLAKARGLGAAHRGTETFLRQRMTAVANVPLVIFLILSVITHIGIGMKEIIEDYVHGEGARVAAILLATFFAVGVALACTFALVKISLGS